MGLFDLFKMEKEPSLNEKIKKWESQGLHYIKTYYGDGIKYRYIGGLERHQKETYIKEINFFKEKIQLLLGESGVANISVKRIKKASLMSSIEIQEKIGLGKIAVFGVFALAMKNKKNINKRYINIELDEGDGVEYSVFLEVPAKDIAIVKLINKIIKGEI